MRERPIKQQLYLDSQEKKLLKEKSKKAGLNQSEFLRSCIKGYKIKEHPTKEIRDFIKQISGIANNINQIAIKTNIRGYAEADELKYLRTTVNDFILEFQKKVYSRE
ncbi:MAG: plasmid mobilization relaxosome protein MobC [Clostridia bacterium]|nr:plasmid mobilization relaxosome protein MobC [Clostridia bacterium]